MKYEEFKLRLEEEVNFLIQCKGYDYKTALKVAEQRLEKFKPRESY